MTSHFLLDSMRNCSRKKLPADLFIINNGDNDDDAGTENTLKRKTRTSIVSFLPSCTLKRKRSYDTTTSTDKDQRQQEEQEDEQQVSKKSKINYRNCTSDKNNNKQTIFFFPLPQYQQRCQKKRRSSVGSKKFSMQKSFKMKHSKEQQDAAIFLVFELPTIR